MRSQYACRRHVETYVKLVLEYHGERYEVRRNPEYMRAGKRKASDGSVSSFVKESAKVRTYNAGWQCYSGKKASRQSGRIAEIMGMDAGQFTQMAMVARAIS